MRRLAVPPLAAALALLASGCVIAGVQPPPPAASPAAAQLDDLAVGPPHGMAGYARDRFPHWRKVDENCDVRDVVLKRDGTSVRTSRTCNVTAGRWVSPFDGKALSDPDQVDVDHMVPLANAWRSGADTWTDQQRTDFANDLERPQLLAVSRAANRAKGDQDPSLWKPPNRDYWCTYAQRWIEVKHYWRLSVTDREKTALREMLGTCRPEGSNPPTTTPSARRT